MLLNLARRMLPCTILVTGFVLFQPETVNAQVEGQLSDKPIAIIYAKDMREKRLSAYAMNFSERMDFAESFRRDLAESLDVEEPKTPVQDQVDGYLIYLVSGPIPDIKPVPFCSVLDTTAARRLFEADLRNEGDGSGVLIDKDNDCFIVERTLRSTRPFPEGADEAKIVGDGMAATSNGLTRASYEVTKTIEEKDG